MTDPGSSQRGSPDTAKEIIIKEIGIRKPFSLGEWLYLEAGCGDLLPQRFSELDLTLKRNLL